MKPQPTMQKAEKTHREILLLFSEYMEDINDCLEQKNPILKFHDILELFFHEVQLLQKQYHYTEDV